MKKAYLSCDGLLDVSPLLILALEDGRVVPRRVLDAMSGRVLALEDMCRRREDLVGRDRF